MTDFRSKSKYILSPLLEKNEDDFYDEDEDIQHDGRIYPSTSFMQASTRTNDQFEVHFLKFDKYLFENLNVFTASRPFTAFII